MKSEQSGRLHDKEVGKRSATALAWRSAATATVFVVEMVRSVLLARLLPVELFGIYAFSAAIVGVTVVPMPAPAVRMTEDLMNSLRFMSASSGDPRIPTNNSGSADVRYKNRIHFWSLRVESQQQ